ncbi:MAG: alanine racemase [Proteobacteria bacterium]|nr:alanine racemase [Pseudomonadota bacterium]
MIQSSMQSSWVELSAPALANNIAVFKGLLSGAPSGREAKLGVVLKSNAYGHGLAEVLSVIHSQVEIIHLISPTDAIEVRKMEKQQGWPKRRILVIGATDPQEFVQLAEHHVEVTLADHNVLAAAQALKEKGLRAKAHVHVETGLSREGFFPAEIPLKLGFLGEDDCPFEVAGVLSHFANTEDVTEQQYALGQLRQFEEGCEVLEKLLGSGAGQLERHISASAAALVLPPARLDSVRVGIALYGFWPSAETRLSAKIVSPELPKLKPVLSWRCRSQIVKQLQAGAYVGYGCTYRCERQTRIAVFPVGYFDGYPRMLSGRAHVLVNGHRAPVLGRVMMNHIVVDVTAVTGDDTPVVATLLGNDGGETVSAEMLAGWAQTIHYEIVTRIHPQLKRIVVNQ